MTPSLLPRPSLIQGVLSGITFSLGYGIGVACIWIWVFLQLPMIPARYARLLLRLVILLSSLAMLASVGQAARWQNSIRVLMKMPEQTSVQPIALFVVSVAVFCDCCWCRELSGIRFRLLPESLNVSFDPERLGCWHWSLAFCCSGARRRALSCGSSFARWIDHSKA